MLGFACLGDVTKTRILIHVLRYHSQTYYFVNYYANKFLKHLESIQLLNIDMYIVFLFGSFNII